VDNSVEGFWSKAVKALCSRLFVRLHKIATTLRDSLKSKGYKILSDPDGIVTLAPASAVEMDL
jgi:hypothetical protein